MKVFIYSLLAIMVLLVAGFLAVSGVFLSTIEDDVNALPVRVIISDDVLRD